MKFKSLLLASVLAFGAPSLAAAQDAPDVDVSFNVGVASDYVFRGVSQLVDGGPQVFAGADVTSGAFYAGVWASNMDFDTEANLEVDIYAGFKPTVGNVTFDLGVLGYLYPEEEEGNVWEAKAAASVPVGEGSLTGSVFYSPEYGEDGPSYWYYEASVAVPLGDSAKIGPFGLSLVGAVGTSDSEDGSYDFTNWRVGLSGATESGWAVDLAYTDTDEENIDLFEGRVVLQIKKSF